MSGIRSNGQRGKKRGKYKSPIYHRPLVDKLLEKTMPEPNSGCWLWSAAAEVNGYGAIVHEGSVLKAHRAAWLVFRGPIPAGLVVRHKCNVRACCNPDHLCLGTKRDNILDAVRAGTHNFTTRPKDSWRGEKSPAAKLTAVQVGEIRTRAATGEYVSRLGREFGVAPTTIRAIVTRRNWAHI